MLGGRPLCARDQLGQRRRAGGSDDRGALAWDTPIALGSYAFAAAVAVDAAGEAVVAGSRQRPDTIARDGFAAQLTAGGEIR